MTPIHHYYHIYADGAWETPVKEHTDALRESGLEGHPDFRLHVGLVGNEQNADRVRDYLRKKKMKWTLAGWRSEGWEQVTLNALADDCQRAEGLVFYGHTKGAKDSGRFNDEWRRRMTYFNVTRWKDAVTALRTYDAYGCHWMELEGNWLFGGNFWWTHMQYLRLLEPPGLENRWRAEDWIGRLRHQVKGFEVLDPGPPFSAEPPRVLFAIPDRVRTGSLVRGLAYKSHTPARRCGPIASAPPSRLGHAVSSRRAARQLFSLKNQPTRLN